jgi:zinc transporter, ZIP family
LPESLGGAVGMRQQGRSRRFAIGVWSATAVVLAVAVVLGNLALSSAGEGALAVLLSFAGGAVLASLADTLMPDAYREGGKLGRLCHGRRLPAVVPDRRGLKAVSGSALSNLFAPL